jgi:hypothetical protein
MLHDENTTQNNTPQNQNATQSQNAAETAICDRYAAKSGSDGARGPDRPRIAPSKSSSTTVVRRGTGWS